MDAHHWAARFRVRRRVGDHRGPPLEPVDQDQPLVAWVPGLASPPQRGRRTSRPDEEVPVWRRELAEMLRKLRSAHLHEGLGKEQVLELAAIRCEWGTLANFRDHCSHDAR